MTKQVETFTHEKFGTLNTLTNKDNEVFFVCKDIASTLDYSSPDKAYKHCKSLFSLKNAGMAELIYEGFAPATKLIKEPDLYRLIFRSHKQDAIEFQDWVCEEVLPSIRNNGGYIMDQENKSPEEIMAHGLIAAQNIIEEKNAKIEEQGKVIQDKNFPMSLSKMFSGSNKVVQAANLWLEDQGYLSKVFDKGHKIGWKLTSEGEKLGYGSQISKASVFWTPDVLNFLPSTIELLDFAGKMGLFDHKLNK